MKYFAVSNTWTKHEDGGWGGISITARLRAYPASSKEEAIGKFVVEFADDDELSDYAPVWSVPVCIEVHRSDVGEKV
jgi:hypothetical protein